MAPPSGAGARPTGGPAHGRSDQRRARQRRCGGGAGAPETARYEQDLSRSIGVLGNVFITLSGVTPASSVFIIVPVALVAVGSGSFLSFVFAAIVGVFMAFCWAELSAAYPIAAGDYALVWHSFKGRTSVTTSPAVPRWAHLVYGVPNPAADASAGTRSPPHDEEARSGTR
jgi:hypothetical protein